MSDSDTEFSSSDVSDVSDVIDLSELSDLSDDEDQIFDQYPEGISSDKICSCGKITEVFLECAVCEGKCCVDCALNTDGFEICFQCYKISSGYEEKIRLENKCDKCTKEWVYSGRCSCHPNSGPFSLCDYHVNRCTEADCNNTICEKNGSGYCPDHNIHCMRCKRDVAHHITERIDHLTCIECGIKTCSKNNKKKCSDIYFPLYKVDQRYPLLCFRHRVGYNRCEYCKTSYMVKCFEPECDNVVCYNYGCDGVFKPKRIDKPERIEEGYQIQAYCWLHRSECNLCFGRSTKKWLRIPPPLQYNIQGAYKGFPRLCDPCYDHIADQYKTMCLAFNRLKLKTPRDIRHLLLKYVCI